MSKLNVFFSPSKHAAAIPHAIPHATWHFRRQKQKKKAMLSLPSLSFLRFALPFWHSFLRPPLLPCVCCGSCGLFCLLGLLGVFFLARAILISLFPQGSRTKNKTLYIIKPSNKILILTLTLILYLIYHIKNHLSVSGIHISYIICLYCLLSIHYKIILFVQLYSDTVKLYSYTVYCYKLYITYQIVTQYVRE